MHYYLSQNDISNCEILPFVNRLVFAALDVSSPLSILNYKVNVNMLVSSLPS